MKRLAFNTRKILSLILVSLVFNSGVFAQSNNDNNPQSGIDNGDKTPYEQVDPGDPNFDPVGIKTKDNFKKLRIHSKDGIVFLSIENESNSDVKINIFDITGKLVKNENIKKSKSIVTRSYNFSSKAKSIYIVKVFQDKQVIAKKVYI